MPLLAIPEETLVTDIRAGLDRMGLGARYDRRGAIDCFRQEPDRAPRRPRTLGEAAALRLQEINLEEIARAARGVKPAPEAVETCGWSEEDDGLWWSGCGHPLRLRGMRGPVSSGYAFCPFCGKPVKA